MVSLQGSHVMSRLSHPTQVYFRCQAGIQQTQLGKEENLLILTDPRVWGHSIVGLPVVHSFLSSSKTDASCGNPYGACPKTLARGSWPSLQPQV